MINLDSIFRVKVKENPEMPSVLSQEGKCLVTYGELDQLVESLKDEVLEFCKKPKPCIGIHCESGVEYIAFTYAIWRLGGHVVPLPIEASVEEKERILAEIAVDAVISTKRRIGDLPALSDLEVQTLSDGHFFILCNPVCQHPDGFEAINTAFIRFSSGTTGNAKGVVLSHESINERINAANEMLQIGDGDRVIWLLSMAYHFAVTIVAYLSFGATIIICRRVHGADIANAITHNKATIIYGAPTHYEWMIQDSQQPVVWDAVRIAIVTTAATRSGLSARFYERFGIPVNRALGVIEIGLPCIDIDTTGHAEGAVGKLLPAYTLKLRQVADDPSKQEILISGPGLFDAYYRPFTPRDLVAIDGFFATGDVGELDKDGHLYINGRVKEIINVGGMKVFPLDIENVLNRHPSVRETCVFSRTHPILGEVPVAKVVLVEGVETLGERDIIVFSAKHLPSYAVPSKIIYVFELPRTPSGKLIRRDLEQA